MKNEKIILMHRLFLNKVFWVFQKFAISLASLKCKKNQATKKQLQKITRTVESNSEPESVDVGGVDYFWTPVVEVGFEVSKFIELVVGVTKSPDVWIWDGDRVS